MSESTQSPLYSFLPLSEVGPDLNEALRQIADNLFTLSQTVGELGVYTVATAPQGIEGKIIWVTDGDGGSPCLAGFDGTSWKRLTLGATIST